MKRLLLGTSSEKKIAELKEIFAGLSVTLVTPSELGLELDPEETGRGLGRLDAGRGVRERGGAAAAPRRVGRVRRAGGTDG